MCAHSLVHHSIEPVIAFTHTPELYLLYKSLFFRLFSYFCLTVLIESTLLSQLYGIDAPFDAVTCPLERARCLDLILQIMRRRMSWLVYRKISAAGKLDGSE